MRRQVVGPIVEQHMGFGGVAVRDMDDQRVEGWPSLGREDGGDCLPVGGVGTEAVDSLGRKGDELAGTDEPPARRIASGVAGTREPDQAVSAANSCRWKCAFYRRSARSCSLARVACCEVVAPGYLRSDDPNFILAKVSHF